MGRDPKCDVQVESPLVAQAGTHLVVRDLERTNGTRVNGLAEGDRAFRVALGEDETLEAFEEPVPLPLAGFALSGTGRRWDEGARVRPISPAAAGRRILVVLTISLGRATP